MVREPTNMPNAICFPQFRHSLCKCPKVCDLLLITLLILFYRQHILHRQHLVLRSTHFPSPTIDSNRVTTTTTHRNTSPTVASSSTPTSHPLSVAHSSSTHSSTRSEPAAPRTGSHCRWLELAQTCTRGESPTARSTAAANTAVATTHFLDLLPRPRLSPVSRSTAARCRRRLSLLGGDAGSRRAPHCAAGSPSGRRTGRSGQPHLLFTVCSLTHSSDCRSTRVCMHPPPRLQLVLGDWLCVWCLQCL